MVNIFRSIGRIASQAARAIKPKRLHGPKYGAKHFMKKHGFKAAILTGGVALGSGADTLIELAKGKPEEQPPIIMLGGELSEHRVNKDSWNLLRFDTDNENFSEEERIVDMQATDAPSMAAHNDELDHGRTHGGHHHGDPDFVARMKAAFILLIIIALICCLLKMGKTVGKWLRNCRRKRRNRVDIRELPRLEIIQDGRQRQVQSLPQRIPHADPSPTNSNCPSYGTAMATAPITGMAFYEEMTAVQEALKLAKTLAVNPTPRPDPSSSNGIPDMETVLRNLEKNTQSHPRDVASFPQTQGPLPQDTAQVPTAQQPSSTAQTPASRPTYPPPACPQSPASPVQSAQASSPTCPPPASPQSPASPVQATQAARSPNPQEPADNLMTASLARLRNSIK